MEAISTHTHRPKLITSFSYPINNVNSESPRGQQFFQSPTSYAFQENDNPLPKNKKPKSKSLPSIFFNSYPHTLFKRFRSEVYKENDEFTNGCFGFLRTLGSKINYKINNTWGSIKVKCKRRLHKNKKVKRSRAKY